MESKTTAKRRATAAGRTHLPPGLAGSTHSECPHLPPAAQREPGWESNESPAQLFTLSLQDGLSEGCCILPFPCKVPPLQPRSGYFHLKSYSIISPQEGYNLFQSAHLLHLLRAIALRIPHPHSQPPPPPPRPLLYLQFLLLLWHNF